MPGPIYSTGKVSGSAGQSGLNFSATQDLTLLKPGMVLYPGSSERLTAGAPGYILETVTPSGTAGGTAAIRGALQATLTDADFVVLTATTGLDAGAAAFALLSRITNLAHRLFGGLFGGDSRIIDLRKDAATALSAILWGTENSSHFRNDQTFVDGKERRRLRRSIDGGASFSDVLSVAVDGEILGELLPKSGGTLTGPLFPLLAYGTIGHPDGGRAGLEIRNAPDGFGGAPQSGAFLAFHRVGAFAEYFGLGIGNHIGHGGWSHGSNFYRIYSEKDPEFARTSMGAASTAALDAAVASLSGAVAGKVSKTGDTMFGTLAHGGDQATTYCVDVASRAGAVADGAFIGIIHNFSGLVIVTNHVTGQTSLFICGGGNAIEIARAGGTAGHIGAGYAAAQSGYVFVNASGGPGIFAVMTLRTRSGA